MKPPPFILLFTVGYRNACPALSYHTNGDIEKGRDKRRNHNRTQGIPVAKSGFRSVRRNDEPEQEGRPDCVCVQGTEKALGVQTGVQRALLLDCAAVL